MNIEEPGLQDVRVITPRVFRDERGFFLETYQKERYLSEAGIDYDFVQMNHSRSEQGTLRGMHLQLAKPQGKLVRVTRGSVLDVIIDCRPKSTSFGKSIGVELSAENFKQLWVPPGYAHGFLVTSSEAEFVYACTDYYDPSSEASLIWNDAQLNADWGISAPSLSAKDAEGKSWEELLPLFEEFYSDLC